MKLYGKEEPKEKAKNKPKYFLEVRGGSIILVGRNGFLMSTRLGSYKSTRAVNQQAKRLAAALGIEVRK